VGGCWKWLRLMSNDGFGINGVTSSKFSYKNVRITDLAVIDTTFLSLIGCDTFGNFLKVDC